MTQTLTRWRDLPQAWHGPLLRADFKRQPDDFLVGEELGFTPDGSGEHLFVEIEKSGLSTFEAQTLLARYCSLSPRDLAFSGMKDKQGITRQWFSLQPGRRAVALEQFAHPQLRILQMQRNSRKLRRGTHRGNRFRIVLRDCRGDHSDIAARLTLLGQRGVPNYFGLQRFGRDEGNVPAALDWFAGGAAPTRTLRGLLLSAARSYLFNALLSARVLDGSWQHWIPGDLMALAGTGSVFPAARATEAELAERIARFDLCATGPLWGQGELPVTAAALRLEQQLFVHHASLCAGLEAQGLNQERRPLRLAVDALKHTWDGDNLIVEFRLERGAYATAVLRELLYLEE